MTDELYERVSVLETQVKQIQQTAGRCAADRVRIETGFQRELYAMRQEFDKVLGGLNMLKWGVGVLITICMVIAAFLALGR